MSTTTSFADFIGAHKQDVLAHWEGSVRQFSGVAELERPALLDHMPELIDRIAATARALFDGAQEQAPADEASAHAAERLGEGLPLSEVVAEYAQLRETISDLCLVEDFPGREQALRVVHRVIDAAIGTAVERYANQRERTLRALDEISSVALGSEDLPQLLTRLLHVLVSATPSVQTAAILLRDGNVLRLGATVGLDEELIRGFVLPIGQGFAGTIAARRQPLFVANAKDDPLVRSVALKRKEVRALYGVPLLHDDDVLGVAHIGSVHESAFPEHEQQLFAAMVARATGAVYQHLLRQAAERSSARVQELLGQVDALFQVAPAGMAFIDRDLRFVRVNDSLAKLNGLPADQHVGRLLREIVRPDVADLLEPTFLRVLETGQPVLGVEFSLPTVADPATPRHWLNHYFPVYAGGAVIGLGGMLVDITDRKLAEQQNEWLVEILELGDACFVLDEQFRFTFVNKSFELFSRSTRAELLARTMWEAFPDAATQNLRYWHEYQRVMRERVPIEFEEYYPPLGTWTDITAYPTASGGIAAFVRDATERKVAEQAWRESEERHRLAVEATALGTWEWIPATGELTWSERTRQIFGIAPGVPLSYPRYLELIHPDDRATVEHAAGESLRSSSAGPFEIEVRIRRDSDGAERWITSRGRAFFDAQGQPERMLGITVDVTETKRQQLMVKFVSDSSRRLSESLDRDKTLRAVVELAVPTVADWCMLHLFDESKRLRLAMAVHKDASRAAGLERAARNLGAQANAAYGPAYVARTGQPQLVSEVPDGLWEETFDNDVDLEVFERVGIESTMAVPLQARGRVRGVLTYVSTSRRYDAQDLAMVNELALRAALAIDNAELYEAAQRAIRTRENILAIVSHDLKNPLGVISMSAGMLQRRAAEQGADPRVFKHLDAVLRATKRMDDLIDDLLDMASIQAERLSVQRERQLMGPLLVEAIQLQEPLARGKGIGLRTDFVCEGAVAYCDRRRILQVFTNLIGNAIKFSRPGDTVVVGARLESGEIVCRVEDTGPGINPEDLPHIFDPYWSARTYSAQGTGLGLFITKGIIDAHGGRIWVQSKPDAGTTFNFTLPVADPR